jgi:hypothetical protein
MKRKQRTSRDTNVSAHTDSSEDEVVNETKKKRKNTPNTSKNRMTADKDKAEEKLITKMIMRLKQWSVSHRKAFARVHALKSC